MGESMKKTLNGNIPCTIGFNATTKGEQLSELCILPVDTKNNPVLEKVFDRGLLLYDDAKAKTNRVVLRKAHHLVYDGLDLWFESVIGDGKIIPIVHDWFETRRLIAKLIGEDSIEYYFKTDAVRDIKIVAQFLTDLAEENGHLVLPYPKTTLRYVTNQTGAKMERDCAAVHKAIAIAKAYKYMVSMNASSLTLSE